MLQYSVITDIGKRDVNEDAVGFCNARAGQCFIVCDGLGGHGMGDLASEYVRNTFLELFEKQISLDEFLPRAFYAAQTGLMEYRERHQIKNSMMTTAAALAADENTVYIGHIGDSRIYLFSQNKVVGRTRDHSVPQMLVLSGQIKDSEIRHHPDRHIVLRSMGAPWEKPMYELMTPLKLCDYDAFLLCTDGFWENIDESEMCALLQSSKTVQEWLSRMTSVVKDNGKNKKIDNYSAVALWCDK